MTVVPATAIAGTVVVKSNGNETLSATTCPLTSRATSRTCTSSPTASWIGIEPPSTTWMPGVRTGVGYQADRDGRRPSLVIKGLIIHDLKAAEPLTT